MRFQNRQDLTKNLQGSVFYSPKLKKAYMTSLGKKEHTLVIYAASDDNFDKKVTTINTDVDFHLVGLTPGFAPRMYRGRILFAERLPKRQWQFGWSSNNTRLSELVLKKQKAGDKVEVDFARLPFNRDWYGAHGFIGNCWTGGFRTWKGVQEDKRGALSPTLAVLDGYLIGFAGIMGEVHGRDVLLYQDFYNSFFVRELRDLGADEVKEIPNA